MLRVAVAAITWLMLAAAGAALAQKLPPQPPPVSGPFGGASDPERKACHPDVMRFCRSLVRNDDQSDIFAILQCLQDNRSRISVACRTVLSNHGQ
jgi:hypothetical protein